MTSHSLAASLFVGLAAACGSSSGGGAAPGQTPDGGTSGPGSDAASTPESGSGVDGGTGPRPRDAGAVEGGGPSTDGGGGEGGPGAACTKAGAACVASNTGCNVGSYYLYDNQWNCGGNTGNSCGPESAYGCADADGTVGFVVTSNQVTGNTAVLSYPAMQYNFAAKPLLSSFSAITSTFAETSPRVGDYEVAYDCWFNDNGNELMIWVDNYNQTPGGTKVASAVALGGRTYDVWWGPGQGTNGYVVFYANATLASGTVDLLGIFDYAATHGWMPAATSSTVDQISFGVEVCSTNGQDATWVFSAYSVTAN